jgi:hypothetical protein
MKMKMIPVHWGLSWEKKKAKSLLREEKIKIIKIYKIIRIIRIIKIIKLIRIINRIMVIR